MLPLLRYASDGGEHQLKDAMKTQLAAEITQSLKASDPTLFESIVVELLVKMGYGGSRKDAGKAIGRSGDEGVDGIIKEDHLGLDNIYVQAKRWEATVSRPEIQKFAGALQGQRARKDIFITTSEFSREAHDYVAKIDSKIVLIDGRALARLMIQDPPGNLGVSSRPNSYVALTFAARWRTPDGVSCTCSHTAGMCVDSTKPCIRLRSEHSTVLIDQTSPRG